MLANIVVVLHVGFVVFLPIGGFIAWRWRGVMWAHLACVAIGVVSVAINFDCPLTTWEQSLRRGAGQRVYTEGFIDHYLTGKVYPHGYQWVVQLIFAACIIGSYAWMFRRHRATDVRVTP